jgi:dipeptidyl-peptidase 4
VGAPRAVTVSVDGARVVFLRSPGGEDRLQPPRSDPQPHGGAGSPAAHGGPDTAGGGEPDTADRLWVFDVDTGAERLVCDPTDAAVAGTDSADLPAHERALRERQRLSATGIGSYATDPACRVATASIGGRLVVVDLLDGTVRGYDTPGPVIDPQPDPNGRRVAFVCSAALYVLDLDTGRTTLLAGEAGSDEVTWGLAEFVAAEEFARYSGYWWAPDGTCILAARADTSRVLHWQLHDPAIPQAAPTRLAYPAAGTANAEVTLHLLDLEGGWVDVHWDRETYPYLVSVSWTEAGGPLVTVLRRLQQHGLVLSVDPRTGETQVHAELADPRWVDPVPGTPVHLADGRVLIGGEVAHDGFDARCLFADGSLLTLPSLYVRRVCGRLGTDLLIEASDGEPSQQHLFRIGTSAGSVAAEVSRLTVEPGWHTGVPGGDTLVIGSRSLDFPGVRWSVRRAGAPVGQLGSHAATPPYAPRPALERVTDRRLPAGVLYPRTHVAGRRLPVLVDVYGGPGHQEVVAARSMWLARQWLADAGFGVVVIDNRGTPGVAPSFEKVIHRRMADVILTDQVDALRAIAEKHPDLDLDRVAIRGASFGGWLAALAILRRPDVYRCASAMAPVTDWTLYDTAYTERYLGLPGDAGDVYGHNSLLEHAAERPTRAEEVRPLLLIHGMADDNVVVAHTLRLSQALLAAGRTHYVLPVTGATHMASGGVGERLIRLELDFIRANLDRR